MRLRFGAHRERRLKTLPVHEVIFIIAEVDSFSRSSGSPGAPTPLDKFRSKPSRQRLHPLENLLLWVIAAHLIFLPWAIGGMRWWSQLTSAILAVIGFALALTPRNYTEEFTSGPDFRLFTLPKLLRFPIFWAGLVLLVYIAIQALNPAWVYVEKNKMWWMQAVSHVTWLPSGTDNPFRLGGPWRKLIVYASTWLVVCSIWIGFTRRRTVQLLLTVLVANGFVLAVFALAQRLAGNGKMFWALEWPGAVFFGSFVYKNHAGAYLLVMLGVSCALAAWFYLRGLRRMEKSNPAGVFVFFSALLAIDILVSYARGATIFMLGYLAVAAIAFLIYQWRQPAILRKPVVTIVMLIGLAFFVRTGLTALSAGEAWDRLSHLVSAQDTSIRARQVATQASWEMLKAELPWGSGAGSFRFLFPVYQQRYPEIHQLNGQPLFWDHAHNDFMEIPAELGVGGLAVVLFCAGFWLVRLLRFFFWDNALSLLLVAALLTVLAHGWTDFLFANPAILVTWCALWPCVALWAEFEEKKLKG